MRYADRGVLLLLCFLTCTFALSLRIGGDSVLWQECPLGTHMDVSWLGDCSAKSWLLLSCATESKFADDAALHASSCDGFEAVASSFVCVATGWGLTVSLVNYKGMVAGIWADTSVLAQILVEGGIMELVESFQYLDSIISSDGDLYSV